MSVVACIYLMVAMSKLPDQNSAKLFILKMGLTFKFPLLCFGLGVIFLSPLGCVLGLDWISHAYMHMHMHMHMHTCTCTCTCTCICTCACTIQCACTYR